MNSKKPEDPENEVEEGVEIKQGKVALESKDLPKWETDELSNLGVHPYRYDQYCKLKKRTYSTLLRAAYQEMKKDPNKLDKETLRKEVRAELLPKLVEEAKEAAILGAMAEATKKLRPTLRDELRKELREEWGNNNPTEGDKAAFRAQIRELEVDSLLFSTACSLEESKLLQRAESKARVKRMVAIPLWVGLGPYLLWVFSRYPLGNGNGWVYFSLCVAPYLICLLYATFFKVENEQGRMAKLHSCSTDYLRIHGEAKFLRPKVQYESRGALISLIQDLNQYKRRTYESYQPDLAVVEEARPRIRARLEEDLDPEKLLEDDFEARLVQSKKA
jgi:hypothetical protein